MKGAEGLRHRAPPNAALDHDDPLQGRSVQAIMVREFQRFGLNPTIRLEEY